MSSETVKITVTEMETQSTCLQVNLETFFIKILINIESPDRKCTSSSIVNELFKITRIREFKANFNPCIKCEIDRDNEYASIWKRLNKDF